MIINTHTFTRGKVALTIHYGSRIAELELSVPEDSSAQLAEVCEPLLERFAEEVLKRSGRRRSTGARGPKTYAERSRRRVR